MKTYQNPQIPSIDFYDHSNEDEIIELLKKMLSEKTLSTSKGWDYNFEKVEISFIETYEKLPDDHRFYTNIVSVVTRDFFEKLIRRIQYELSGFKISFEDEYDGDPGQLFIRFYPSKKY